MTSSSTTTTAKKYFPITYPLDSLGDPMGRLRTAPIQSTRQTVAMGDVVDSIFANGFEVNDPISWDTSVTDNGDLSVEMAASYWGDYGLRAEINDTNALYVADDTPNLEKIYLARFYLDPSRLTIGTSSIVTILTGLNASNDIFRIQLQKTVLNYQVRIGITDDAGTWTDGAWQIINSSWTAVEVKWEAMEDNGYISLWIDGVATETVSPVDNYSLRVDSVRLGVLSVSGTGTAGTLYFDDFESRRRSNIGILPDPGMEEPEPVAEPGWNIMQYTYDTQKPHAVTSLSSGEGYTHDANGNMITRVENNVTWTQAYTADNRLASITDGTTTWLFSYDGDGNRVAQLVTNSTSAIQTSYYAGGAYEVTFDGTTTTTKKYYAIAGQTVAMDDGSGLKYLLTDHLGSTVGVTDAAGELDEWTRYLPFGEERSDLDGAGLGATDRTYTGQRNLPDTGLMDYKARMYDPYLKRFIQPDTNIPESQGVIAWDRYAYCGNNPTNFNDPSGHFAIPAGLVVGVIIALKVIDYGWTAYDAGSALITAADTNNSTEVRQNALQSAVVAVGMELIEPDDLSPIGLPIDDIIRHGDDIVNTGKKAPVVIGETMKRVKEAAREVNGKYYQAWKIEPWNPDLAMKRNERWIRDKIKEGREIIDIGSDPTRKTRSPFYVMEKRILDELEYWVKKYDPK